MKNRARRLMLILLGIVIIPIAGCGQDSQGASIVGLVTAGGNVVPGAIVMASKCPESEANKPTCTIYRTETVGAGENTGQYRIVGLPPGRYLLEAQLPGAQSEEDGKYLEEGVEVRGSDSDVVRNIEIPTGVVPRFVPGTSGYVFASGARNEAEIRLALVSVGIFEQGGIDFKKVPVDDVFDIKYRSGKGVFTRRGQLHKTVWKVVLPSGRIVYVEIECGNVAFPIKKARVLVATATPAPRVPTSTPIPTCVTQTPVPTLTPTSTCVPGATKTPVSTPTRTSTPSPSSTPTRQPTPTATVRPTLEVSFWAEPSHPMPFELVALVVEIVGGTAQGLVRYSLDCEGDGLWEKEITTDSTFYRAEGLCKYLSGTHTARMKATRQGVTEEGNLIVNVVESTSTPRPTPTATPSLSLEVVLTARQTSTGSPPYSVVVEAMVSGTEEGETRYTFRCSPGDAGRTFSTSETFYRTSCNFSTLGLHTISVEVARGWSASGGTTQIILQ